MMMVVVAEAVMELCCNKKMPDDIRQVAVLDACLTMEW
jgi:hypothetical protein